MSNGIGKNPLLDISKVYQEQIATEGTMDIKGFAIPKKEQEAAAKRVKDKTAAKMNIRGNDSEEQKKRLEKKRGMKLDDHPQYKTEAKMDPVGQEDGDVNNDGKKDSTDSYLMKRRKAISKAMGKKLKESRSLSEVMTDVEDEKPIKEKKINNSSKIKINPKLGEAVEELGGEILEVSVDEAVYGGTPAKKEAPKDTRMVVTAADKKANTKAYQNYKAGDKRYKAADHMGEEVVDEALTGQRQMRARDMKGTPYQKGGGKRTARDNKTLHNLATRNEGPGTPGYEKKSTGGKGGRKYAGYGDQGAGNKARRRAGEQPMRGNRDPRNEEFASEEASMTPGEIALQKKKARLDRMIAMKRTQQLSKQKGGEAQPTKAMGEEASDAMKDRRMERGGVGGNTNYKNPPKNNTNKFGKGKTAMQKELEKKHGKGKSAMDIVRAEITKKHGKGALIDTKKKKDK